MDLSSGQNLFSSHLLSINLPSHIKSDDYAQTLAERNIYVSARGKGVRISLNVFNTEEDVDALIQTIK